MDKRDAFYALIADASYSAAAAPITSADAAFRRSVVARRSPMRRSSALRLTARRSPAPCAGRTRLSA